MVVEKTKGENGNELFFPQFCWCLVVERTEGENGNLKFESFLGSNLLFGCKENEGSGKKNENLIIILIIILNSEYVMNSNLLGQIAI